MPQSLSTDPRYACLSWKAKILYPLLWVNADDQGRLPAYPEKIKLAVCAAVPEIAATDVEGLLEEMHNAKSPGDEYGLIIYYHTNRKTPAVQITDWWGPGGQRPQWAWPSEYDPPPAWADHLRYKRGPKEVVKVNWPPYSRECSGENCPAGHCPVATHPLTHPLTHSPTHPPTHSPTHPLTHSGEGSGEASGERSGGGSPEEEGGPPALAAASGEASGESSGESSGDIRLFKTQTQTQTQNKRKRKLKRNPNAKDSLRGETSSPRTTLKLAIYNKLNQAKDSPKKQRRILVEFCRDYLCHPAGKDPGDLYGQVGRMQKLIPNPFELFSAAMLEVYERGKRGGGLWDPMTFLWAVVNGRATESSKAQGKARSPPE